MMSSTISDCLQPPKLHHYAEIQTCVFIHLFINSLRTSYAEYRFSSVRLCVRRLSVRTKCEKLPSKNRSVDVTWYK